MKEKITAKKALSLMLCVMMLFSVIGTGFTVGAAECTHPNLSDSNWELVRKTTCQKAGLETQWCYDCGTEVERQLPFDENAHVKGEWTTVRPHTCQQNGYDVIYCMYGCKDKETGEPIILGKRTVPAHDYEVVFRQEPTCQQGGYEFIACLTCYDMKTNDLPVDPDAHYFTPWSIVDEATCIDNSGKRTRKCLCLDENSNACGFVQEEAYTDKDNHTNVIWNEAEKVAPTCDAPGYIPGVCEGCGEELTKELAQHSESPFVVLSFDSIATAPITSPDEIMGDAATACLPTPSTGII